MGNVKRTIWIAMDVHGVERMFHTWPPITGERMAGEPAAYVAADAYAALEARAEAAEAEAAMLRAQRHVAQAEVARERERAERWKDLAEYAPKALCCDCGTEPPYLDAAWKADMARALALDSPTPETPAVPPTDEEE